jgi:DNA-binding transcriptional MerR regulator
MTSPPPTKSDLVKMSTLAQRSGVPAATIKHYLREGLLPEPGLRTSRNMAFYDAGLVERIQRIKELQRTHFLPLKVIKGVLDGSTEDVDAETAAAIHRALLATAPNETRTRAQLVSAGMPGEALDFFVSLGLVTASGVGDDETYAGDDLALLRTLGASRRAGITPEMLPPAIIEPYVRAIRELVRTELEMFREGVVPRAGKDLAQITETATKLSEQLVVLIRRKMLLPTLRQIVEEEQARRAKQRPRARKGAARKRKARKGTS